jgi:hypothetical protein
LKRNATIHLISPNERTRTIQFNDAVFTELSWKILAVTNNFVILRRQSDGVVIAKARADLKSIEDQPLEPPKPAKAKEWRLSRQAMRRRPNRVPEKSPEWSRDPPSHLKYFENLRRSKQLSTPWVAGSNPAGITNNFNDLSYAQHQVIGQTFAHRRGTLAVG